VFEPTNWDEVILREVDTKTWAAIILLLTQPRVTSSVCSAEFDYRVSFRQCASMVDAKAKASRPNWICMLFSSSYRFEFPAHLVRLCVYTDLSCKELTQTVATAQTGTNAVSPAASSPKPAEGFVIWNWGILYSFSMPLAAFLMAHYFRALDSALLSLDNVIKPSEASDKPFTEFLAERVRSQWSSAIFPISLLLTVILALAADGRDIIAPLQSIIRPTCTRDWSTVGYTQGLHSPVWYFAFNCVAFSMEAFLGYCGIVLLLLTGGVFGTVFSYGLGSRRIVDAFRSSGTAPPPERYHPNWIWCRVRCGLEELDVVFVMFTGLSLFALVASAASIFVNVYLRHHPTTGSIVLAVGTMFFIPWSAFWIFVPYFTNFPRQLPADYKPTENPCPPPDPWPFGSEKLSWTLIVTTALFWLSILTSLLSALFSIPK